MNDNPQPPNQNPPPEFLSRHEERRRRMEERRAARAAGGPNAAGAWIVGAILIILGLVFLVQNLGGMILLNNWWALFILIPAVGAFGAAWRTYQAAGGHLTLPARGSLVVGLILLLVTAIFLLNLSWTLLGPIVIILAGIGLLLNVIIPG
jgi:hypothetical protein